MTSPSDQGGRTITSCPRCQSPSVSAMVRTDFVVYLRCPDCAWVWAIPERRMQVRPDDQTRVFGF
jgi:hypothetical protein